MKSRKKPKKRAGGRRPSMGTSQRVDCSFECPAKGRLDFGTWLKKGETASDACWRELEKRIDKPQVSVCKNLRARKVD